MAWSSPNTVIPNLPGVSPHNIPIPLTPAGQPMQMQMYPQQQQGYYLQAQPQMQMQMPGYGQAYQPVQAAPFGPGYQPPMYGQSPYMMPAQPGMYQGQARERARAREDNPPLDKWIDGSLYGPVLDATTATILGVKLQINPILRHHSEQDDEGRLSWDVLDTVKDAHIMHGSDAKSWKGRDASATFPRMTRLILHSNHLPGAIEVVGSSKSGAVTCADIVNAIHEFVKEKLPRQVYDSISRSKRTKLDAMYHHNRSGKPRTPGPDFGTGVRKGDFLEEFTAFDGLEDNEDFVRVALGLGKKRKEPASDDKSPAKRMKQRPWVGHLLLNLDHRGGENVEVPVETEASESPEASTKDLEDEDDDDDDDDDDGYVQARKGRKDPKQKKQRGKANLMYQQQQQMYPPGMVPMQGGMMYAAPGGYMPMQQPMMQPMMQQQPIMGGYVPAMSPAIAGYQQQGLPRIMQGNIQGYPSLGTPLPGHRPFQ